MQRHVISGQAMLVNYVPNVMLFCPSQAQHDTLIHCDVEESVRMSSVFASARPTTRKSD
jgi:hypothetical protein